MTIVQLQYVLAVKEYKSINAAAKKLYVAQSSISGAIKDLEEEFQNDEPLKNARKQYLGSCILISIIWLAFIVLMIWFTISLKT